MKYLFAILLFCCPSFCFSETGELRAGGGLLVNTSSVDPVSSYQSKSLLGGQFHIEGYLTDWMTAELMVGLASYQFHRRTDSGDISIQQVNRFHIPLLFRFPLFEYFSLGAGFYGSYRMGTVHGEELGIGTSANDTGEHGLEGAARIQIPFLKKVYWLSFDYRHSYSLTPRSNEGRNWTTYLISISKVVNL